MTARGWVALGVATTLGVAGFSLSNAAVAANGCGVERWAVKTGTDADARRVNLDAQTVTSVGYLASQPMPNSPPATGRIAPVETTQWVIDATLVEYKLETDSDYHLVLHDAGGASMVGEIPFPGCVAPGSPFATAIQRARTQFDASHSASDFFTTINVRVQVTGVGFFDRFHGQTGAAANAVELHPITNIVFNPGAAAASAPAAGSPAPTTPGVDHASAANATRVVVVVVVAVIAAVWVARRRRHRH